MKIYENESGVLYQGDCLEVMKSLDAEIDLVLTDPPYELTKGGTGKSKLSTRASNMHRNLNDTGIGDGFDLNVLPELVRLLKNINAYFFCNKTQLPLYFDYFIKEHGASFDLIKWVKTNPTPLFFNSYMPDTEYCFFATKGGCCKPQNYADASTLYQSQLNKADKEKYGHPTPKPIPLLERLLRNSSKEGDLILDPFAGSGSTAEACMNTKRRFIIIEQDEGYCKKIINRLENHQPILF